MRKLIVALAGASVLAACDPTEKHDYGCYAQQLSLTACVQFHITEIEGNVASVFCERGTGEDPPGLDGTWEYSSCDAEHGTFGTRTAGYCRVDDVGEGYSAKVYFYEIAEEAAQAACDGAGPGYAWVQGDGS
jgi:hypothetical protein